MARGRGRVAQRRARRAVPRRVRVGERAPAPWRTRRDPHQAEAEVRARRGGRRRALAAARLLSPEPAEHVHRQADAVDARRRAGAGESARLGHVRRYLEILRSPHVGALVASSLFARLPIGINALAIVLYLREQTGSFAVAGAVSGALALGSALGAPVQGRFVDRIGPRRVLLPVAIVHAFSLGAIVAFAELDVPAVVLLVCGFLGGFAIPPTSSVLRSQWTELLEPHLHQ